jgi:hypothetical protein
MILDSTTEKITLVLAGATTTSPGDCDANWTTSDPAAVLPTPTFGAGSNPTVTNGTTSVDLVPVPTTSTMRVSVQDLSVVNSDTAAMTVTIRKTDGATHRKVFGPVTILPNEKIQYERGSGWKVFDAAGAIKGVSSPFVVGTYILAQLLANQNFAASAFTTIIYGNEVSDALGEYNPATGEVTIKNTGRYLIAAYAQIEAAADGSSLTLSVFRNGVDFMRVGSQNASNPAGSVAQSTQIGGATFANLTVGDVITIRGFTAVQQVGGTLKFLGLSQLTNFSMMRVG